jgi:hypothetical protein
MRCWKKGSFFFFTTGLLINGPGILTKEEVWAGVEGVVNVANFAFSVRGKGKRNRKVTKAANE